LFFPKNDRFFPHFSSRFTDSKRYESVFERCFDLSEERSGEICNACVLLVKRFVKLPAGSDKHWGHVVDARSGPGIKANGKAKKLVRPAEVNAPDTPEKILKRKHVYKRKGNKAPVRSRNNSAAAIVMSSFLDSHYWRREKICCGSVFVGARGEVAVDAKYYNPCEACVGSGKKPAASVDEDDLPLAARAKADRAAADRLAREVRTGQKASSSNASTTSSDVDEGFFDRPVISPSSVGTPAVSENDEEDEEMGEEEEEEVEEVEDEVQEVEMEEDEEEEIDDDEDTRVEGGGV